MLFSDRTVFRNVLRNLCPVLDVNLAPLSPVFVVVDDETYRVCRVIHG